MAYKATKKALKKSKSKAHSIEKNRGKDIKSAVRTIRSGYTMQSEKLFDDIESTVKDVVDDEDDDEYKIPDDEYDNPFDPTTHEESMEHLDKITEQRIKEVEAVFKKNYEDNKEQIEADMKYYRDKINREDALRKSKEKLALFTDGSVNPETKIGIGTSLLIPFDRNAKNPIDIDVAEMRNQLKVKIFEDTSSSKLEV